MAKARTLKGTALLTFIDEKSRLVLGTPLSKTFRHETPEQTAAANRFLADSLAQLAAKGLFGTGYNPGARRGTDITMVYVYISAYEDNGTPESVLPYVKSDLDTVEMQALIDLFDRL